ncbi:glycosidase [Thiorhodococcus minor]|uniref:Glycosidase n=1 Tax=Thiorhodococcus minor TaxID=57489 RepID=A0A6M0JY47_9GAMM|nr:glycosidase [Thiorhodococcus minor]NEV62446.1 glycosidase [Thiorhodococcus minor]
MRTGTKEPQQSLPNGVMLNAYPDSIGRRLSDTVALLRRPELEKAFAFFYILPTFFNSDLDRGFSVIDYDHNPELVSPEDLEELNRLEIMFKFDLVLNHLSVRSPQFQDLLQHGDASEYRDFFIDWNAFWAEHGEPTEDGHLMPKPEYLEKLFMRKPGAPILKVRFPDGSERPYWNTFYQEIRYGEISPADLGEIEGLTESDAALLADMVNARLRQKPDLSGMDLNGYASLKDKIVSIVEQKRDYLGQMDLNARSEKVWHFYDETLRKLRDYGAKIIRLDAFAYLHKEPGEVNFFNRPGTWDYLERLRGLAEKHDLIVFPEIHAEYGSGLHEEVASKGFPIYDFFFPGLVIDALERGASDHLLSWIGEIQAKGMQTINMLGCHDGIPVLDLSGKQTKGKARPGLLDEADIEAVMSRIIARGGRVKSLYGPDGKKISYYQVNATFFSALGEDERKLLLARAIQLFMPGIPQVWYLDLFAGKNDYVAADRGGPAGHKEINRTNLSLEQVEEGLQKPVVQDQLKLIRLRNTSPAFQGKLEVIPSEPHLLHLSWSHGDHCAVLRADLRAHSFSVEHFGPSGLLDRFVFD